VGWNSEVEMKKRILFCTGEGIGNVIQTIPVVRTLKEVLNYKVDFWHMFGAFSVARLIPYAATDDIRKITKRIQTFKYEGLVSTFWTREHIKSLRPKLLNKIVPLSMDRSEIDTYMDIARDLGAREEDLIWWGECNYNKAAPEFDVVISDGYNRHGAARWEIKHYPHYKKVVELLIKEGLTVCSIGANNEYVEGTQRLTGLPLLGSTGVIKKSKVLLSNDSGMYHVANALSVPNVVIFTATSIEKNFDSRFHKFSTIIGRDDLNCRPCQAGRRWARDCHDWRCRDIEPEIIVDKIKEAL
jgi:ADP-heptose:LPS heptosyltransferase